MAEAAPHPPVTVAVVSWNTRELLLRCLRSLREEARAGRAEVWVVDNGSGDGSPAAARAEAPWAKVVEPGENLGFGPAVNLVASRTRSPWLLAANADVALEPGALETMLQAGADPRVGAVAPRLLLRGGETQHSVYPLPTVTFTLLFNLGVYRLSRRTADRLCLEGWWDPARPRAVPWAIAACLLLRRSAYDAVGGFEDRQWLYAEDLDLGWRLHDHGWITRYEPSARVRHESGAATAVAFGDARTERFMAATYDVLLRRRGRARTIITAALNIAGAGSRMAWMAPLASRSPRWAGAHDANRRWFSAHLRGARSRVC